MALPEWPAELLPVPPPEVTLSPPADAGASHSPAATGVESLSSDALAHLAELAGEPTLRRAVGCVREFLRMEVAFLGEIAGERQVFRVVDGDGSSFGIEEGGEWKLKDTYCQRMLEGRLPSLIPDVQADERAAALSLSDTAKVGSFVSMPLRFRAGELYGTLCAASHDPRTDLGYQQLQALGVFARMAGDMLERAALAQRLGDARVQGDLVEVLIAAADNRDAYCVQHSKWVVERAVQVGRRFGLTHEQLADVRNLALLHNAGKLAIPDEILRKPGPLSDSEWKVMHAHPIESAKLLARVPSLRHLAAAVRACYEHWDGSGYPDGLAGEQIPLASRIILVCNAFCALTSDRSYRRALSLQDAAHELVAHRGTRFCPRSVDALLAALESDPASAVALGQADRGSSTPDPASNGAPAFHRARCACQNCGAHTISAVGYKVGGQCPNCGSYELREIGPADEQPRR